jgi:hypothetical protein
MAHSWGAEILNSRTARLLAPVLADRNQTGLVFGQYPGTGAGLGTSQTF